MKKAFIQDIPSEVQDLFNKYIEITDPETKVFKTTTGFNVQNIEDNACNTIINLKKINDIRFVKFL